MKLHLILAAILVASFLHDIVLGDEGQPKKKIIESNRSTRQTSADQMVQNILQWLQGVYNQQSRRSRFAEYQSLVNFPSDKLDDAFRQGTFREYLPPANTQKPRPFEPISPANDDEIFHDNNFINGGYPPAGSITPQPPFPIFTNPVTGAVTAEGYQSPTTGPPGSSFSGYPTHPQEISTQSPSVEFTGHPTETTAQPSLTSPTHPVTEKPGEITEIEKPGFSTQPPIYSTGYPSERPDFSTQPPPEKNDFSTQPPLLITTGYHIEQPDLLTTKLPTVLTTQRSELHPELSPTSELSTQGPSTHVPVTLPPASPTETFTSAPTTQSPETNTIPTEKPEKPSDSAPTDSDANEDLKHPPHIHAIDVECAKDMMTINIEFNREFNGVIYSKGYYNMPECRYVKENTGQTKYSFTVNLNMCGTEFINAFDTQGQSYLENVLILQNEIGIQEIWDTVRAVRCLWEGNLKESLSVALSVGMLSQEIVTFSGDTAMAKLDIVLGKGPFGHPADGLVKIGEPMTLVVSVSGDPGFDIQVRDCKATDSTGDNIVPLTDDNGCILKPKLFGAFQKTHNTGNTGASIIAYAYFNAFKFPDVMDLMIECNIELCKTDCEMCPNPNQQLEPGRRKRDLNSLNHTLHEGITMGKQLRIILPEDLNERTIMELRKDDGICMSTQSFMLSCFLLISLLVISCLFSAYIWLKTQRFYITKK